MEEAFRNPQNHKDSFKPRRLQSVDWGSVETVLMCGVESEMWSLWHPKLVGIAGTATDHDESDLRNNQDSRRRIAGRLILQLESSSSSGKAP